MADSKMFELSGVINISGKDTNVSMFLDDDSVGRELATQLVASFNWVEIEESEPFKNMSIERW